MKDRLRSICLDHFEDLAVEVWQANASVSRAAHLRAAGRACPSRGVAMLTTVQFHQRSKLTRLKYAMRVQRDPTSLLGSPEQLEQRLAETKPIHPKVAMARAHSSDGLRWRLPVPASVHLHLLPRPASASPLVGLERPTKRRIPGEPGSWSGSHPTQA